MSSEQWDKKRREVTAKAIADRARFLEVYAETLRLDKALEAAGHPESWFRRNSRTHREFFAAYQALKRGGQVPQVISRYEGTWDGSFSSFRQTFLGRSSPWYHEQIAHTIDRATPGTVHLIITCPEHGKTAIMEDFCTYSVATKPETRILYGHSQIDQAKRSIGIVRSRLEPDMTEYAVMHRKFGPFAPDKGNNQQGIAQVWAANEFNVYKRPLGVERDYSMRALGMNSNIAGTRADKLFIDDPQEIKTLTQTDKIMHILRDDWFTRPGAFGVTIICMNVVGDGDIAEELIRSDTCDSVTIFKAFDEAYLDLGPRPHLNGEVKPSPWLWPERYDEAAYARMKKKAGIESWERKYQQDWRPATTRSFTTAMIEKCSNPKRTVLDPPPRHPGGGVAEIAVSLDPGFTRAAVNVACFEPTRFVQLDTVAGLNLRTLTAQIDMLEDRIRFFHHPPVSAVKWVTVETKAFQKAIVTDDSFLELRDELGFEVVEFMTDWKKNDNDYGITQMARSMERGEFDFPTADPLSKARFDTLFQELYNWRPSRGNQLVQDEIMAMWFNYVKWHKIRRQSIHRPTDASAFGFKPLPESPLSGSDWRFGLSLGRR